MRHPVDKPKSLRQIFLLAILVISYGMGVAQSARWGVGMIGGPNIALLQTTGPLRTALKPAFRSSTGLQLECRLKQHWWLLGVPTFERKGSRLTQLVLVDPATGNTTGLVTPYLNYGYVSFPLLLQYKGSKSLLRHPIHLMAGFGVYAAALVSRVDLIRGDNIRDSVLGKGFVHDKRLDFGLSASLGVEFPIAQNFSVNLRALASKGIYNFNIDAFSNTRLFHQVGNLLVGISYTPRQGQASGAKLGTSDHRGPMPIDTQ
jgi:Outer membrane protein beta-barrel domain